MDGLESGVIEKDVFSERYEALKELIEQNRRMQAELRDVSDNAEARTAALEASFEAIASFAQNWDLLDDEGKAALLQTVVKQITVTQDEMHLEVYVDSPPPGGVAEVSRMGTPSLMPLTSWPGTFLREGTKRHGNARWMCGARK